MQLIAVIFTYVLSGELCVQRNLQSYIFDILRLIIYTYHVMLQHSARCAIKLQLNIIFFKIITCGTSDAVTWRSFV